MGEGSQAPPPSRPSRSSRPKRTVSAEGDFWADLFQDLTLSIEWLGQALDAIPTAEASAEAVVRLRGYSRALEELRPALARVQSQRSDPELKPLFDLGGPLAGFLSRLYAWCEAIGDDFERMAIALRRGEPTRAVFSHSAVNKSYAEFDALFSAMRHDDRGDYVDAAKSRELDERIEELIWATEWLHLALARSPGD